MRSVKKKLGNIVKKCHLSWKWDGLDGHDPKCSRCGHVWPEKGYRDLRFCPYCGAKVVER